MTDPDSVQGCAPEGNASLTPYEMIGEAGHQICAILSRGNLTYDMAPELYRALYLIDCVIKDYDGAVAMAEKEEAGAVVH